MHDIHETSDVRFIPEISRDKFFYFKVVWTSVNDKLQLTYEIMFGYVQKL